MTRASKPFTAMLPLAILAAGTASAGSYPPSEIVEWSERSFAGHTRYTLVSPDGVDHAAVLAECREASASALILEREHELASAPVLEWRWRVDDTHEGIDETTKAGDDYPARVYVVAERWPAFRSRAINYVWSSEQPRGSHWENAFASQFVMVAVRSGNEHAGEWKIERRDVAEDFRALHGFVPDTIDVLAIMTDCDNTGRPATARYGPMRWLAREARQGDG